MKLVWTEDQGSWSKKNQACTTPSRVPDYVQVFSHQTLAETSRNNPYQGIPPTTTHV